MRLLILTVISMMIALIILLNSISAHATEYYNFDNFTKQDIALQTVYTVLHVIDWGQTLNITSKPDNYHEINPLIGEHPTRSKVNLFMGTSLALHTAISFALPKEARTWFQVSTLGIKASLVANNYYIGLKATF